MRRISKAEAVARAEREIAALPAEFGRCPMCAIAAEHPDELTVLARRADALAILDRFPARHGHVVVVLRRHAESVTALSWQEYAAVQRLAWEAAHAVERVLSPPRVFVASLGSAGPLPTSFPHHHVHVIPLVDGEGQRPSEVLTWSFGVGVYEGDEARLLAARLVAAWPRAEADAG